MYHLSSKDLTKTFIYPRIPNNFFTKNSYENSTIARVCFTPSITNCLMAMSYNLESKLFYVYKPVVSKYLVLLTNSFIVRYNLVPDAILTKECWILNPIRLKKVAKIKVYKVKDKEHKFNYGNKVGITYKWNYEVLAKYV